MSLFYGLAAGLFVSASTWAAMTYISQMVGICLGFFLLTFFAVSTIYVTGDEFMDRQKTLLKAMTSTEMMVLERLKDIDARVSRAVAAPTATAATPETVDPLPRFEALLALLDTILQPADVPSPTAATPPTPEPTLPPASEDLSLSTASDPPQN
jgi:hypothetical protein